MRLKKGFTLSEILIVLMIIGVLATLTIPALMKGVNEAQYKTAYRKALNTISNLTAMEKVSGILPGRGSDDNADKLFDDFVQNLSYKSFVSDDTATSAVGTGKQLNIGTALTDKSQYKSEIPSGANRHKNWIITDDNIAYLITTGQSTCETRNAIVASHTGTSDATGLANKACFVVWVDVNSLTSGPNTVVKSGAQALASSAKMPALVDDQYPIYIGQDGATPGHNVLTVTGRMTSDMK